MSEIGENAGRYEKDFPRNFLCFENSRVLDDLPWVLSEYAGAELIGLLENLSSKRSIPNETFETKRSN